MRTTATILLSCLLLCLSCSVAMAQTERDEWSVYNANITASAGTMTLHDDYLSPLDHYGWKTQLNFDYGRFFQKHPKQLAWYNRWNVGYGEVINRSGTVRLNTVSASAAYGVRYFFYPIKNFEVAVGGVASADFMVKFGSRNVNNPASGDGSLTIGAAAHVGYLVEHNRFIMKLSYELETPLLGAMFVPEMGESYYEMWLGNLHNVAHFASVHNNLSVRGNVNVDFVLKHCTLRLQMQHHQAAWHANNLKFRRSELMGGIGFVTYFKSLSGKQLYNYTTGI